MSKIDPDERSRIIFFHPDLGIGGAERLIVDAAVGLQNQGHTVTIYTSHCDPSHCFDEARDGTLDVRVRGNAIPATVFGRFKILCAILRQYVLIVSILANGELQGLKPDVFLLDQLSAGIPLLRWIRPDVPVLFYCHFPDLLLVQGRTGLKALWRAVFDGVERWTMRGADGVLVNSEFTKDAVSRTFGKLGGVRGLQVVYPGVDTDEGEIKGDALWSEKRVILSVNRFERKKNIELAIQAYAELSEHLRKGTRLVIAGGYDTLVAENVDYHKYLEGFTSKHGLRHATARNVISAGALPDDIDVVFLLSIPSSLKSLLLRTAKLLVYTPENEHFGIVPLEAMVAKTPVLATNTGGPLETVEDGVTGWVRSRSDVAEWTKVMALVASTDSDKMLEEMGTGGQDRVKRLFSKDQLAQRLNEEVQQVMSRDRVRTLEITDIFHIVGAVVAVLLGLFLVKGRWFGL